MVSPCGYDFPTNNVYQNVTTPPIDKKEPPPKKIAFLIEGLKISNPKYVRNSSNTEARGLAQENEGLEFDCIHAFDPEHLFAFFRQFPHPLHKRLSLYIIRLFTLTHVDDTVDNILKPVFKWMYEGQPTWLNELYSESYPATFASIQAEMGGLEFMDAEYELIKKSLLRTSKQASAEAFKKFLEANPSITEVYALIGLIHINFLDRVIDNSSNQRHIIYNLDNRQVTVHLFGKDSLYPNAYEDMSKFAIEQGLKIPTKKSDDKSFLQRAFVEFKEWREDSCHYAENDEELVEWLQDDDCAEKLIKTFEDFEQLVGLAKENGFNVTCIPTRKAYEKAIQIREAKKRSSFQNTTVYHDRTLQERLAESKQISELWIKSALEDKADRKMTCFKTLNTAMGIFYSIRRRNEKGLESSLSVSNPIEIHSLIDKIFKSRSRTILGIFPVNNGPLPASELPAVLKKYLELITLAQEAVEKFDKREMPFFDPLVGENACQVRAAMFAEILNKEGIDDHIKLVQKQLAEHAERIKAFIVKPPVKSRYVDSFKSFLEENDAIFDISEEILIIISSFILSETKVIEFKPNSFGVPSRHERILAKIISERKGLVPNFANAIIKMAQSKLSELSVIYVQRIALQQLVSREEKSAAMLVFDNHVKIDDRHRKLIPCYPTMRLLFKRMLRNKTPLVLRIEQFMKGQSNPYGVVSLLFGNGNKDDYSLLSDSSQVLQRGAVFVHTKSITEHAQASKALEEKVLSRPIIELILSALADHPQYASDDSCRPENPECDKDRQLAHRLGTCRSNPSLFMLEHIYCDLIKV